jgi:hypothetical protein
MVKTREVLPVENLMPNKHLIRYLAVEKMQAIKLVCYLLVVKKTLQALDLDLLEAMLL